MLTCIIIPDHSHPQRHQGDTGVMLARITRSSPKPRSCACRRIIAAWLIAPNSAMAFADGPVWPADNRQVVIATGPLRRAFQKFLPGDSQGKQQQPDRDNER